MLLFTITLPNEVLLFVIINIFNAFLVALYPQQRPVK